jgi:dTDP-4-amino-4,6-dideoxygalactose transaminase
LHLALLAAGVERGDEVIVPAFSFTATAAAVGYTGARPVFVDIDPDTFTIDPKRIEAAISPRTRAIVPVHLYGHPAAMDAILAVARDRDLRVVEDAAQAHGAAWLDRRVGTLGDAGCFSFYPSKNLGAAGEGGMVVTSHRDWADRIRALRNWGTDARLPDTPGFNCRMDALQAAILGVKLAHLDAWNHTRRAPRGGVRRRAGRDRPVAAENLAVGPARAPPLCRAQPRPRRAATCVARRRRRIAGALPGAPPSHGRVAIARSSRGRLPQAERAAREVVSIPIHPELEPADVEHIAATLRSLAGGRVHAVPGATIAT